MKKKFQLNSAQYWNSRFLNNWRKEKGDKQTTFFCYKLLESLPQWLKRILENDKLSVCDVGCAEGQCVNIISKRFKNLDVIGVDVAESAVKIAKQQYPEDKFAVEGIENLSKHYDVIICSNVLEHFQNPQQKIKQLLKKTNRHLIIMVPFDERHRLKEHMTTFENNSFKPQIGKFVLSCFKVVDLSQLKDSLWNGKQAVVVYSKLDCDDQLLTRQIIPDIVEDVLINQQFETDLHITKIKVEDQNKIIKHLKIELNNSKEQLDQIRNGKIWKILNMYFEIRDIVLGKNAYSGNLSKKLYNLFNFFKKKYQNIFLRYLLYRHKNKPVIVYPPTVDWNITLFQRPQHLAINLAKKGVLFFYFTSNRLDKVDGFEKISENLYLSNRYDMIGVFRNAWFIVSSTHPHITIDDINRLKSYGFQIIYDYIDKNDRAIIGDNQLVFERHKALNSSNTDLVITTAKNLYDEMVMKFGKQKVVMIPNGVEINDFIINKNMTKAPSDLKRILEMNKPIIGYYGALASWLDYKLINAVVKKNSQFNFVFIGVEYDSSIGNLSKKENVFYLGSKNYSEIPNYAQYFDVAIIPFKKGKIAKTTSPLKLYEYMASKKQVIVTEDMDECRNYVGVYVSKNDKIDFSKNIKLALKNKDDRSLKAVLYRQASENTWEIRAKKMIEYLERPLK